MPVHYLFSLNGSRGERQLWGAVAADLFAANADFCIAKKQWLEGRMRMAAMLNIALQDDKRRPIVKGLPSAYRGQRGRNVTAEKFYRLLPFDALRDCERRHE